MDTGLEQFMVPPAVEEQYGLKIQEFEEALGSYGLKPGDIDIIIHTHLHNDHCENDYKCTQRQDLRAEKGVRLLSKSPPH